MPKEFEKLNQIEDQINSKGTPVDETEDDVKTACPDFDHIIVCGERTHILFEDDKEEPKEAEDDDSDMKHLLWDGPEDSDEEI